MLAAEMTRHTTFKFCLDPGAGQQEVLTRHAGAARVAFNQCLGMVKSSLTRRHSDPSVDLPWTGFDLINTFNAWKKTEAAGRLFTVASNGCVELLVTGLACFTQVCQQVFEEAAVDCGKALAAWADSRSGRRKGKRVGFPRFKIKTAAVASFRLRNKHPKGGKPAIRVGDNDHPRTVTLPGIGVIAVHDDTRRLRRMLAKDRARICYATVSHHAGRWYVALNVEAADLHPARRHMPGGAADHGGWVGIDRGLSAFLVAATADGTEVARIQDAPKALAAGLHRQRHLAKKLSRKKKGSVNCREASYRLARHHRHVRNVRRHFLHKVSNELVKTHDRLVLEDLNVSGMLRNHRLARAISDAGWAEFARLVGYKQTWRDGDVAVADRWYPSSRLCPACGTINADLTLADRLFICGCGHSADRDVNAAANLAGWAEGQHDLHLDPRTPKHGGRATNARRRDGADRHTTCAGFTGTLRVPVKPARLTREPRFTLRRQPEPTTPEKGGAEYTTKRCSARFNG
jgi:putative transposase